MSAPERTLRRAPEARHDTADITVGKEAEDRIAVASNWKLVWWRFRRHHLAMASAVLLIFMYIIVAGAGLLLTQDPERTDARQAFIPVQTVHLFDDGGFSPWVPAIVGKRNPDDLAHGVDDRSQEEGAGRLLRHAATSGTRSSACSRPTAT